MRQLACTETTPIRLDKWLKGQFPALPPTFWHKHQRAGRVKVNGKKQPLSTRLTKGDTVTLWLPDDALSPQPKPLPTIYEDEDLLVLDKPAGLPTLAEKGPSLHANALSAYEGQLPGGFPAPCHRLDTGTSGLVLFAKNAEALRLIESMQQAHAIGKEYTCVTAGHPVPASAKLEGWHTKDAKQGRVRIGNKRVPGAKPATTLYETRAVAGDLALLDVRLYTGRTHQIRAHLASIGTPLLGDSKYGSNAINRAYRCKYQCLCATCLTFPAITEGRYHKWSGLILEVPVRPWYETQLLAGTLKPKKSQK